ncbi:MAG TPA: pimeloyl-ACP methyl ester esterase BioH [Casimicrobiaceae bacterium]|nr:pimeloyl-ACP methyl ester esterase BioH [Casimicrobiaceae bacterium]
MTLHVESTGNGPPLVVLHGWAMHSGLWMPALPKLASRFRVHLVDLPGHGHSPPLARTTLAGMAFAVAEYFASLPEAPTVLGWSLGGAVALQWALDRPDAVAKLILVAATPCFVARDDWPHAISGETLRRFGDELAVSYRTTLQRFVTLQLRGSEHQHELLGQMRTQLFTRGAPTRQSLEDALDALAAIDLRARVGAITQPALVIAGQRDTLVPAAAGAWLAAALPAGRLASIAGAAHAPFLSHPEAFFAASEAF